jgi:hypothetical protein
MWGYRVLVFYDWQNETADLDVLDADWNKLTSDILAAHDTGDVNGDDFPDLCLLNRDNATERTEVECYFGSASGLPDEANLVFLMPAADETTWMQLGDVNCDGFEDVVVGLDGTDPFTGDPVGLISVLPGGSDVTGTLSIGDDVDAALRIEMPDGGIGSFFTVDDVDGDGCSDIFALLSGKEGDNILAYKGDSSLSYGSPQTVDAATAAEIVFADADTSSMGDVIYSYLDINGDGFKDLMYDETVMDYENGVWYHEQIFVPGGLDFFGPDQVTMGRDEASAIFIDQSGVIEK